MWDKLDALESELAALERELFDPAVHQNPTRTKELGIRRSELMPIVDAYQAYRKLKADRDNNLSLIQEGDDLDLVAMAREENLRLDQELISREQTLKEFLIPKDPNDEKNVFLEIRAGTGGEEAALFAADLFRMYSKFADRQDWKMEIISQSFSDTKGFREIIASVSGRRCYSILKFETGVHRVQRVPATEAQGRVHTSTVTVAVLPEADEVDVQIKESDLRIDVFRSSGPGGQSVNTTDSAVRITHVPTGVVVSCQDEKSQHKNKAKALRVLRTRLLEAEQEAQREKEAETRRKQVGTGDRSERVRTYNFPQNRLTDHRIGFTSKSLDRVMEGDLDDLVEALRSSSERETLGTVSDDDE